MGEPLARFRWSLMAPGGKPLAVSPRGVPDGTSDINLRDADRPPFREAIRTPRPAISGIVCGRASRVGT